MAHISFKSTFMRILHERGFLYQAIHAEGFDTLCAEQHVTGYIGCDATAPSLHVGNLMGLMVMKWFYECGHRPLLLLGGGTTKVGDPSGRDKNRTMLSDETITRNIEGIHRCYAAVMGNANVHYVNNATWLENLGYISFLRHIGVHFSVNRMLAFESVKNRLAREEPLSFIEFNYMLMQAYDFLILFQDHHCVVQFGGSDQWGNITAGADLIKRITGEKTYGVTWPLLTTASGAKMGKSAQGSVWLDGTLCSPFDYWQFWRNTDDRDVLRFLKLYTMLPLEEIEKKISSSLHEAKILLADEATALLHGHGALADIHRTASQCFSQEVLCEDAWVSLPHMFLSNMPDHSLAGILVAFGFCSSKKQAQQRIIQGAAALNHEKITEKHYIVTRSASEKEKILLSFGQKHGVIVL